MTGGDKCFKCSKIVKVGMTCCLCGCLAHSKCMGINDEIQTALKEIDNFRFFCDVCTKFANAMTDVNKSVDNCSRDLMLKIDGIGSDIANMSNELADIKKVMNANVSNVAKLIVADSNVDKKVNCLKDELNSSYADIVKCEIRKSVDEVSSEVRSIKKIIDDMSETESRVANIVVFNLIENNNYSDDKKSVMNLLKQFSEDINEGDLVKSFRLGRKKDGIVRPLLVKFCNVDTKMLVMKNRHKIKDFDDCFRKINVSDDMTKEQRLALNELVAESKTKESADEEGFFIQSAENSGKVENCPIQKTSGSAADPLVTRTECSDQGLQNKLFIGKTFVGKH